MNKYEVEFEGIIPLSLTVTAMNEKEAETKSCKSLNNLYRRESIVSVTLKEEK